mgnify:CR=1 FL=1
MVNSIKLKSHIEKRIEKENLEAISYKEKLDKDFMYGFSWYSEPIFKSLFMARLYETIFLRSEGMKSNLEDSIKGLSEYFTQDILEGYLSVNSSSSLSNSKSIWELECKKTFVRDCGDMIGRFEE